MSETPLISMQDIWKSYPGDAGPVDVLRGVDVTVRASETVALTGESGSGKSTLMHLAGGLDQADRGAIVFDGEDLATASDAARAAKRRSAIGIVFQQFNLIPSLSVAGNLSFQARLAGREDPAWTASLTSRLGLDDHVHKYPETLSGGQQQRVAIGRALAVRPALVLADEPTGNLDESTSDQVLALMLDLVRDTGAGLLIVTHSERVASRMDRRLTLRQGVVADQAVAA